MRFAIFVDPTAEEHASAVEIAAFAAEFAHALGQSVVVSCTPLAALEIGLALLGKAHARTLEGGERPPSPLVLASLIDASEPSGLLPPSAPDEVYGTLADLVDLGVIGNPAEAGVDFFTAGNPVDQFIEVLHTREISTVIGLGSCPDFWEPTKTYLKTAPQGRLLRLKPFFSSDVHPADLPIETVRPAELPSRQKRDDGSVDDEFDPQILGARSQAATIAGLIQALLLRSE